MPSTQYPLLFSPIRIGSLDLRNRLVLTGHGTGMAENLLPSEQLISYYAERAKGGVGLMMIGSQQVHPTSPGITGLLCNYDDAIIPGLRRIADAVHGYGARAFAELSHMGLATSARPIPLWGPSPVAEAKYGEVAHEMTFDEIEIVLESFADAAERCLAAGMDGIELQGGHGLLIHQFMSPYSNKRTDRYGGSFEGRLRLAVELAERVRARIGPDIPFGFRISGDELVDGGLTLTDMQQIAPILVEAGQLDFLDVTAGNDGHLVSNMLHEPPMGMPPAGLVYLAAGIKEVVDIPVIHATRINNVAVAERVLQDGLTDLVGMCRALIADPHLPNKAQMGREEEINPCIGCNQACLGRLHSGNFISCIGNPITGRETQWAEWKPAARRKKVIVAGGGVAGLETAIVAARRGHNVTLIEKQAALGGRLLNGAKAPTRDELADAVRYRVGQLAKLGIEVRTGEEATAERIAAAVPDVVVVATGVTPSDPDLPRGDTSGFVRPEEIFEGTVEAGKRVLIVDYLHDQRAMTVADFLAERGRQVEIVSEGPFVGHRVETRNHTFQMQRLVDRGVFFRPNTRVMAVGAGYVTVANIYTMEESAIGPWDTVVAVTAGRAEDRLFHQLRGRVPELYMVGDCYTPRDMEAAILEGHTIGRSI